jgi:hypothetical protein
MICIKTHQAVEVLEFEDEETWAILKPGHITVAGNYCMDCWL